MIGENFRIVKRGSNYYVISLKTRKEVCYFPARWVWDREKKNKIFFSKSVYEVMSNFEKWT